MLPSKPSDNGASQAIAHAMQHNCSHGARDDFSDFKDGSGGCMGASPVSDPRGRFLFTFDGSCASSPGSFARAVGMPTFKQDRDLSPSLQLLAVWTMQHATHKPFSAVVNMAAHPVQFENACSHSHIDSRCGHIAQLRDKHE